MSLAPKDNKEEREGGRERRVREEKEREEREGKREIDR